MGDANGFPGVFLKQLNVLAGKAKSFMHKADKKFQTMTPRLEKACGFFPHTSFNIVPSGLEFNMYIVEQKDQSNAKMKQAENIEFFNRLETKRTQIDRLFGPGLIWNFKPGRTTHQQIAWRLPSKATDYNQDNWFDIQCVLLLQFSKFRYAIETALIGSSFEDTERAAQEIQRIKEEKAIANLPSIP